MPRKNLPYVNSYKDRTGKMRYYLRRPGCRQIALSGEPGSREFMQSYAGATVAPKKKRLLPKPSVGQIYYLSDGEHIKIGFTISWKQRRNAYRTHSARTLELLALHPGTIFDEKRLHKKFSDYRVRTEWFYPSPELLDHIKGTVGELNAA